MERRLIKTTGRNVCRYIVAFDDYGIVDTIARAVGAGPFELLVSTHADARAILRNADGVRDCTKLPPGFAWDRKRD